MSRIKLELLRIPKALSNDNNNRVARTVRCAMPTNRQYHLTGVKYCITGIKYCITGIKYCMAGTVWPQHSAAGGGAMQKERLLLLLLTEEQMNLIDHITTSHAAGVELNLVEHITTSHDVLPTETEEKLRPS